MKSSLSEKDIALTASLYPMGSAKTVTKQPDTRPDTTAFVPLSPSQKAQAAKRLDWRFFLPHPALKRVGYWGPCHGQLAQALAIFAQELTLLKETPITNGSASTTHVASPPQSTVSSVRSTTNQEQTHFDLVVLSNPPVDVLQRAVSWLRPGGAVYVEAHGALWPQRWFQQPAAQRPFLLRPKDYSAILQQDGLRQVQALWIWPSFDKSTKIIPLDAPNVLSYVSAYPQESRLSFRNVRKAFYQKWLLQSEWFGLAMPCFSIIAN